MLVYSERLTDTPVGTVELWATDQGLRRLGFHAGPDLVRAGETLSTDSPPDHLGQTMEALEAYFGGDPTPLDVPVDLNHVTPFQQRVYDHLITIPRGRVTTYGEIARALGAGPGAARAVGSAVGANPVAIVIPCHRVVASDGRLTGYGGGLHRKARLLRLEGVDVDGTQRSSRVRPGVLRLPL